MVGAKTDDLNGIRGLTIIRDYISPEEEVDLLDMIDARPWTNVQKHALQFYGSGAASRLPGWGLALAERLQYDRLTPTAFDQCIVDELNPGQGFSARLDDVMNLAETVVSLNLGAPLVMEFRHTAGRMKLPVLVPARSLLIMTDAARYNWRRAVTARKADQYDGLSFARGRHVSLTFRQTLVDMVAQQSVKYA